MAIDQIPYRETESLAHTSEKSFYPVKIPVSHWQLRHYIALPEADHLYYASGHDIYCLNTSTKKRKHIATLDFEARCTASGYGWVCVGGEDDGRFAAIKLDGSGPRTLDVDSALPLDYRTRQARNTRAASVKVERIGEEIVNSISIHRIHDEEAHLDDIVAVLTNNDKTVRVYSLPQNMETTVLDLPFAMNHATISPDGTTLIAVGDFNQAYFFVRELQDTPPQIPKPHNRLNSTSIEWTLTSVVTLHVSGPNTTTGYFTTAWSPSGQLVAVGSESGYITVFDMEMLANPDFEDEEAVVAVIPGSRVDYPAPHPGAVRSMLFSPEPWDLLIWAEDQGRICIGDLRTGLRSKQFINIDPTEQGLRKVVYYDIPSEDGVTPEQRTLENLEAEFLRRYRYAPDSATTVNFASEYILARRRQRNQREDLATLRLRTATPGLREVHGDDPRGLTMQEQQILESLRIVRQREEARAQGSGSTTRSVNYTTPDIFAPSGNVADTRIPALSTIDRLDNASISDLINAGPDTFPELVRTSARPSSSHGGVSGSDLTLPAMNTPSESVWASSRSSTGLVRLNDGSRLPRRRASVILTPPSTNSPASATASQAALRSAATPVPASVDDEDNPWRTIEDAMSLARGPLFESTVRGPPIESAARAAETQAELEIGRARARSLRRERDRLRILRDEVGALTVATGANTASERRLAAFQEGYDTLLRRTQLRGLSNGREIGVRTAGLAMSPDGRTLWAACEEGIFEIPLKLKGRLYWPSVDLR